MSDERQIVIPWRRNLLLGVFVMVFAVMVGRAFDLQILNNEFLQNQGDARVLRDVPIPANRGMITDRHGEPLAISTPVSSIWAEPQEFSASSKQLSSLARVLGLSTKKIKRLLKKKQGKEFVYLKRHVNPAVAKKVLALGIPGIAQQKEYHRYYPAGEVAAHLLGFTDIDDVGQEGLELAYNDYLRGQAGRERVVKDGLGRIVGRMGQLRPAKKGDRLELSIDRRIQYLAYRELLAAVNKHRATSASAIVLDIKTGEVVAQVNQPSFNPNNKVKYKPASFRNRVVTDLYEPGSTIKPFIVATALSSGRYKPGTMVNTTPGLFRVGRSTIRDIRNYGMIDVGTVLQKSSNIGASKIALSLERKLLWNYLTDFGFGVPMDTGFPGESTGIVKHYADWRQIDHATIAYGYGLSTSMLQLAQAYAALLGDGHLRPVSFTKLSAEQIANIPQRKVLEMDVVMQMRKMLARVVSDEGTAALANVNGYQVAGKTGTVRKAGIGGYMKDNYLSLFAGVIPVSAPRLAMVVVINDPRGEKYYGGTVAGPVFSKVMMGAMRLLNIPPDAYRRETTRVALIGENK